MDIIDVFLLVTHPARGIEENIISGIAEYLKERPDNADLPNIHLTQKIMYLHTRVCMLVFHCFAFVIIVISPI